MEVACQLWLWMGRNPELLVFVAQAVFSGLLVIATVRLWLSTRKTANAASLSAEAAKEEARAIRESLQPSIQVDFIGNRKEEHPPPRLRFTNNGSGPATLKRISLAMRDVRHEDDLRNAYLGPGNSYDLLENVFHAWADKYATAKDLKGFANAGGGFDRLPPPELARWLSCSIEYENAFEQKFRLNFSYCGHRGKTQTGNLELVSGDVAADQNKA